MPIFGMIGTMGTNRVKGVDQSDTENQRHKGYLNGIKDTCMYGWAHSRIKIVSGWLD